MISSFSDAIEWDQLWPVNDSKDAEMSIKGHLAWVSTYQKAAESISLGNDLRFDTMTFAGPVMQLVGLTTELTLKTILRGGGQTKSHYGSIATTPTKHTSQQEITSMKSNSLIWCSQIPSTS